VTPPATALEQALQVLARRDQQRLGVHLPKPSEAEASQPVPVLGFTEEWLDPDLALEHRLQEGGRVVVTSHAVEVVSVEGAASAW
jgi:hypothetical protein